MTVSTEVSRSEHGWTGAETSFSTGWPADAAADVKGVFVTAAGAESALTQGVHYTASVSATTKLVTCTPITMPATSGTIVFYRVTPALVAEVLEDGQDFPAAVHQRLHDRAAMRDAEQRTAQARSMQLTAGGASYDVGDVRISNLADGVAASDAATVGQLDALVLENGNVPSPGAGDVAKVLGATGAGAWGWVAAPAAVVPDGGVATIKLADDAVTNAKLANVPASTIKGRYTAGSGDPEDMTGAQARTILSLQGCSVSATAAAGALTVTVKGLDGADMSATNPVTLLFRSATATDGVPVARALTANPSLVVSSGSTLGVPAINTPFALWIVAFDDAGTVRLGVINCLSGENIFPLGRGSPLASSTAEGGAGAADSAHVFYTGTAVTSKAYTVLGRLEWSSGLATLGTWTGPSGVATCAPGMKLPGDLVQIASDRYTANAALSTAIPNDDTVPTNTEGTQINSLTLTPTSAANRLHARFAGPFDSTSSIYAYAAMFDGGSAAVATVMTTIYGSGYPVVLAMERAQAAANTSSQTWSVRVGGTAAIYANGLSSGRKLGGSMGVTLIVSEVQV